MFMYKREKNSEEIHTTNLGKRKTGTKRGDSSETGIVITEFQHFIRRIYLCINCIISSFETFTSGQYNGITGTDCGMTEIKKKKTRHYT